MNWGGWGELELGWWIQQIGIGSDEFPCDELRRLGRIGIARMWWIEEAEANWNRGWWIWRIGIGGDEFACDELRRLGRIGIAGDEFACNELRTLGRIGIAGHGIDIGVDEFACDELRRLGRIGIQNSRVMNWERWGELESLVMFACDELWKLGICSSHSAKLIVLWCQCDMYTQRAEVQHIWTAFIVVLMYA